MVFVVVLGGLLGRDGARRPRRRRHARVPAALRRGQNGGPETVGTLAPGGQASLLERTWIVTGTEAAAGSFGVVGVPEPRRVLREVRDEAVLRAGAEALFDEPTESVRTGRG